MLTNKEINENKIKYLELMSQLHFDMTNISAYLDAVGYFEAPYTTQYLRAYPGGLCQTALEFYNALKATTETYLPGVYTEEDLLKVALFRNMYRAEMYEYNPNKNCYQTKKDRPTYGDLGFSSYMTARHFVDFTDEQVLAICHGSASNTSIDIHEIRLDYPLVTLVTITELLINLKNKGQ